MKKMNKEKKIRKRRDRRRRRKGRMTGVQENSKIRKQERGGDKGSEK